MSFSEKCFFLVLSGFVFSVALGFASQYAFDGKALGMTLIPITGSLCVVHVLGTLYRRERDIWGLWGSLLIWLYFPMAAIAGYLSAALGCSEGIITPSSIESPFLNLASVLNIAVASTLTVQFLRRREIDHSARLAPFLVKSWLSQAMLGPLLLLAYSLSR
ncbi:MAG: hypothetical protein R3C53_04070 [Pirellulaceae bacterium]